jgi:hypothetical protein
MNRILTADVILTLTSIDAVSLHDAVRYAMCQQPEGHELRRVYAGVLDLVREQMERQGVKP